MSSNKSFITVEQHNKQVKAEEMKKKKEERQAAKIVKEQQQAEKQRIKEEKEALKAREDELKPKRKTKKIVIDEETKEAEVSKEDINDVLKTTQVLEDENTITNKLSMMINIDNVSINYEPKFEILKDSKQSIKKIIHIADIHIRLSTLHDEYNEVFEKLYDELRIIKQIETNTLICLCGDLLHSKDELKPNTIIQTWNFIKNLSDIFPLIIITGNHDTIELNNNKIDSITAILKDRPINNTYYLLNSGVYIYNNIIFGISSIIDKFTLRRDIVSNVLTTNNYSSNYKDVKYIGLYHGSVDGCIINDYGTRLRGTKKVSSFACPITNLSYDYILLGDIHKFQYLDKNKTVAYSSSLISQNFTETDDYHGFLEWNILDGSSRYHKIKNNYAYHIVNINELYDVSNIDNISSITFDKEYIHNYFQNNCSGFFRIEFNEDLLSKINREFLKNQINALYPLATISWLLKRDKDREIKIEEDNFNDISNNSIIVQTDEKEYKSVNLNDNSEYINNLIRRYMQMNFYGIKPDIVEKVLEYLNKIILETKSIEKDIEYVNSDWKILWLSFDNMYGYGPNNVIDFTKYPNNEIVGIFGDNAIGKSSIIDIITYMLYSRSARDDAANNPKDIVNVNSSVASGIIIIESNNIKYLIKRSCRRIIVSTTSKIMMKTSLMTYKMIEANNMTDNSEKFKLHDKEYILQSLTEENRLCTDNVLVPIIGTYDNFITTSVLLQGNNKSFKNKTNPQKKDFLCQILKIEYFNKCESVINERFKALKTQFNTIKNISNNLNNLRSITDLNNELNDIDQQIINCENKLSLTETNISSNYECIQTLSSKLIPINDDINNVNISNLNNIYDDTNQKIINGRNKILDLNDNIVKLKSLIIEIVNQNEIIHKFEEYNNKLKKSQDDIMHKINYYFNEKQKLKLYNVSNFREEDLNEKLIVSNNKNNKLCGLLNEVSSIYDSINEYIKKMFVIDDSSSNLNSVGVFTQREQINDDNQLILEINNLNELNQQMKKYTDIRDKIFDDISIINNDVKKLDLIPYRDLIIREYNDFIEFKKNKQTKIMECINNLMIKQQINLTYIDPNIKLDMLLANQVQILSLLNDNHNDIKNLYRQYENVFLIDENYKIDFRSDYLDKLNDDYELINNQSKSLWNLLNNNKYSLDDNLYHKNILEQYFKDEIIQNYRNNRSNIITIYQKMRADSASLIYESLDEINLLINKSTIDRANIKNNVDIIKSSFDVILDKNDDNTIIKKYNEIIILDKEYDEKIKLYNNIIADIKMHNKINMINSKLDNIKNTHETIKKIKTYFELCEKISNDLTVKLDDILNNISIINSNNEKQEQINKNNKKIDELRQEYDNITVNSSLSKQSVETIYNIYNLQQYDFINFNEKLTSCNKLLSDNDLLINSINEKILNINTKIDVYNNTKHMLQHNNKIQDNIENLYDDIDGIKSDLYDIEINDVSDIKTLLDLINEDIRNNKDEIKEYTINLETIKLNNKTLIDINNIDDIINKLKIELDELTDPNNKIVNNFINLQNVLVSNTKHSSMISNYGNEIIEIENNISRYCNDLELTSNQIKMWHSVKEHIELNNCINLEIINLKENIKTNKFENKELLNSKSNLEVKRNNLLKLITDIEKTNNELDSVKTELNIYELLNKLTSRDGVQLFLLSESLQTITNKVNGILEPFINKTINMQLNGDMIELSILSKNNVIHTISGMESFMLDLVFKIIIAQISVIPKSNIIFLDESISVLDAGRMASIEELFTFLKQYYSTVFLITHMKQVKNHISHSLNICRHNSNSLIFNIDLSSWVPCPEMSKETKPNKIIINNNDNNNNMEIVEVQAKKRRKPKIMSN